MDHKKNQLSAYLKYSGLGMQMIITMMLAAWVGTKLDEYFEIPNRLFTIFFLLFSVIASIYLVIKSLIGKNEK